MERLDLRLVEYFVTVAEELHFGRAAERLHIAQPSLSQQIRRFEGQLGVTLFDRDSRNVRLTPAGEALLHESRPLLRQAQRAIRCARTAAAGSVTVGFYGSAASALLPGVLRAFSARQPGTELSVRELLLGDIDEIVDGTVDIAFARLVPGQVDLAIEVLTEEPRLVALPRTHPLADRDALGFGDLREESFIVNPALPSDDEMAERTATTRPARTHRCHERERARDHHSRRRRSRRLPCAQRRRPQPPAPRCRVRAGE